MRPRGGEQVWDAKEEALNETVRRRASVRELEDVLGSQGGFLSLPSLTTFLAFPDTPGAI